MLKRILDFFRGQKTTPSPTPPSPAQTPENPPPPPTNRRRRRPYNRSRNRVEANPPPAQVSTEMDGVAQSAPDSPADAAAPVDGEAVRTTAPRRRRSRSRSTFTPVADATASETAVADSATVQPEVWDVASFDVPPQEGQTRFHDLNLPDPLLHAIAELQFNYCTPIQAGILPHTLQQHDALGRAQTGTGKTAAFLITVFTRLLTQPAVKERRHGTPRALVLAPTRELVIQISKDATALAKHTALRVLGVYGGMDYNKQQRLLKETYIDLIIATPGRLLDFHGKHDLHLSQVEVLVIDEADRMLDMGFIPDVRQIVRSTPPKTHRQTLLFSATLSSEVKALAANWTRDPVEVEIEPENKAAQNVEQKVYIMTREQKITLLVNLIQQQNLQRVMVFSNWRDEARRVADMLKAHGIEAALLSGDVPQAKRVKTLEQFRTGEIVALVATDVAGRGIHVEGVSHVINYSLPQDPEDYVHRIGRTGRAGESGTAVSFADEEDSFQLPAIQEYLGKALPCEHPEEALLQPLPSVQGGMSLAPRRRGPSSGVRGLRRPRRDRAAPPPRDP